MKFIETELGTGFLLIAYEELGGDAHDK